MAALSSLALLGALPTAAHAAGWAPGPQLTVAAGSTDGSFAEAPDGSSTAVWSMGSDRAPSGLQVQHARPDGSVATPLTLGAGALPVLATSTTDETAVDWLGGDPAAGTRTVNVTLLDAGGAIFTGTVAGPSGSPLTWDFGDGNRATGLSVRHVFADPSTYPVTASATDDADNVTVVTKTITVTAAGGGGTGGGGGGTSGGAGGSSTAGSASADGSTGAATPPAAAQTGAPSTPSGATTPHPALSVAVAAGLKVSKATRPGARVTVAGTISSRAKSKATITYVQRVGRTTVRVKRTATVAKGRWSATLTLPHSLTKGAAARGKGTVTVTFPGTAAVKRATAKHAVSIPKK